VKVFLRNSNDVDAWFAHYMRIKPRISKARESPRPAWTGAVRVFDFLNTLYDDLSEITRASASDLVARCQELLSSQIEEFLDARDESGGQHNIKPFKAACAHITRLLSIKSYDRELRTITEKYLDAKKKKALSKSTMSQGDDVDSEIDALGGRLTGKFPVGGFSAAKKLSVAQSNAAIFIILVSHEQSCLFRDGENYALTLHGVYASMGFLSKILEF
jgi:hypothetical protein